MKILRAIGGFFAKIGRWIASTAWIQPLLIVGGIFGIIFSIPYIKKGIEGLQNDTTDYEYKYYSDRSLSLQLTQSFLTKAKKNFAPNSFLMFSTFSSYSSR